MAEEMFDVVDENDIVVAQAPRSIVHRQKLLHRAVHIFVLNSRGELLLQMRSAEKDEYPSCYTSSASGHLGAGETYAQAAPRELEEELGLKGALEWLARFPAGPETSLEHTHLFRTIADHPPHVDPQEVAEVTYHSLHEIARMIVTMPLKFSPCFVTLFNWYVANFATDHSAESESQGVAP